MLYAHTPNEDGEWDHLCIHLREVAAMARRFADVFKDGDLAYLVGLTHDLGKANPAFQKYLIAQARDEDRDTTPHAWAGAAIFSEYRNRIPWAEICMPIAGHHAGLGEIGLVANRIDARLAENREFVVNLRRMLIEMIKEEALQSGSARGLTVSNKRLDPFKRELRIRMLFSALVDADWLATEAHFSPKDERFRSGWPSIEELWERFKVDQEKLMAGSDRTKLVNKVRNNVYENCLKASAFESGFFRLTVPTGEED